LSGFGGRGRSFGERKGGGRSRLLLDLDLKDHLDRRNRLLLLHHDLVRLFLLLLLMFPFLLLCDPVSRQSNSSLLHKEHDRLPLHVA